MQGGERKVGNRETGTNRRGRSHPVNHPTVTTALQEEEGDVEAETAASVQSSDAIIPGTAVMNVGTLDPVVDPVQ